MKTFIFDRSSPRRERPEGRALVVTTVPALARRATGWLIGALLAGAALNAAPLEIKLPAETARLAESKLPGYALAQTHCFTCHSVDYVRMQPVSTRAYWKSSVVKMQKTFGAPIPDDAVEPIAEYLAKTYGTERASAAAAPQKSDAPPKK